MKKKMIKMDDRKESSNVKKDTQIPFITKASDNHKSDIRLTGVCTSLNLYTYAIGNNLKK